MNEINFHLSLSTNIYLPILCLRELIILWDTVFQIEKGENQHDPFATSLTSFAGYPHLTHPCYGGGSDSKDNKLTCLDPAALGKSKCTPSG